MDMVQNDTMWRRSERMLRDEAQHKEFSLALDLNNANEGATRVM